MRAKTIIILFLLSVAWLSGCGLTGPDPVTPQAPTPEQISRNLVEQLNAHLVAVDPVGYVIDAQFQVLDARYKLGNENVLTALEVLIDCRSQAPTNCGKERTTAVFFQALKARQGGLSAALPDTLRELTIYTYDHVKHNGTIKVKWKEVRDYLKDVICGAQLAARLEIASP